MSSSRGRRWLVWISGAVLVIGIAVLADRGTRGRPAPHNVIAARRNATVPVNPVARRVARRFLETAVGRNDLATAYRLVGPMMKGVTRAKWIKGHNPVTYYPSSNLRTAPMTVKASRKSALMLEVVLKRRPKVAGIPTSYAFDLQVIRIRGKWLVNYFMPYPTEPGRFANT